MRKITAIAALGAMSSVPLAASALGSISLNASLGLTATVAAGCTSIAQSTPFTFPSPLVQATEPVVLGGISTTCAATVPAVIQFDGGLHSSSTVLAELSNNTASPTLIGYELFQSTAPSTTGGSITGGVLITFGAGAGAGVSVTGATGGAAHVTSIWAALISPVPADIASGTYSDEQHVTLFF